MQYFVGWDVGGWNCNKRSESQDAVAVLELKDDQLRFCGTERKEVFRGNIRDALNKHDTLPALINELCGTSITVADELVIAIDTPLGFPSSFQALVKKTALPESIPEEFCENPYLFRKTEEWLFSKDFPCLSAIKDMIGSQATKGMHLLRKYKLEPTPNGCGIWQRGRLTAIETYPTTCRGGTNDFFTCDGSAVAKKRFKSIEGIEKLKTEDRHDATYCAIVAFLFAHRRSELLGPISAVPDSEGWIWVPKDAKGRKKVVKS